MQSITLENTAERPKQLPTFEFVEVACPICDSRLYTPLGFRGGDAHRHGLGRKVTIVRCSGCTHIYPKPMPQLVDTNQGYGDADEYFRYHDPEIEVKKSLQTLKRVRRFSSGLRLLDVGCGRGELVHAAERLGFSATGVETSAGFAESARQVYGIRVVNKSLQEADFRDCSFDVVTLGAVLEHVYRPLELLGEIERILATDGILWLEVPNDASLYCWFMERYLKLQHTDWSGHLSPTFEPYHVQGFTVKSMLKALSRVGLDPVDVCTLRGSALPGRPSSLRQRLESYAEDAIHLIAQLFPYRSFNLEVIARKPNSPSSRQVRNVSKVRHLG